MPQVVGAGMAFRSRTEPALRENGLGHRCREAEQLEYVSEQLLQQKRELVKKNKTNT